MTYHDNMVPGFKTRVWKDQFNKGFWTTTYYLPYSGILSAQFESWQEAMDEACNIESLRLWI